MTEPDWDHLRSEGRVVVDAPARKLAVYPNAEGHVVMVSLDGDVTSYAIVCPGEHLRLAEELSRSMKEARRIENRMEAEYGAHLLIERARGS